MSLGVTLNTLDINTEASGNLIQGEIAGLGAADIRLSTGVYAGKNGGYANAFLYGLRNIGWSGVIVGNTVSELETRRRAFYSAVSDGDVAVHITTNAGNAYLISCKLHSLELPLGSNPLLANYQLELVAPDPVIYDDTGGAGLEATLPLNSDGGASWPLTWPIAWSAGSGATTVNNSGAVEIYPTITLTGTMSGPQITNLTTAKVLKLTDLTTNDDADEVVIDFKSRTVLLNGGNVLADVSTDSDWWSLQTGDNTLSLTTTDAGDTVSGLVKWKPGYMGI